LKSVFWVVFMLLMFYGWPRSADAEKQVPGANEPIEVVAQTMEADKKQQTAIFSGKVVATRGALTLYADQLTLFFTEQTTQNNRQKIERIEARGKVSVVDDQRIAKANELDYHSVTEEIVLRGNVSVQEGENLVTGDEITLDLRTNQTRVKSRDGGRIKAIFQPEQESK